MAEKLSPAIRAAVIADLEAGFSKSATARRKGVSLSSVKRIAADPSVKPGKHHAELVKQARDALHSALTTEFAKNKIASLVIDDLSIAASLRDNIATLEEEIAELKVTCWKDAVAKSRTIVGIASASKLNSDNLRLVINWATPTVEVEEEMPELVITEMLSEEVSAIREQQHKDAVEMGITLSDDEDEAA